MDDSRQLHTRLTRQIAMRLRLYTVLGSQTITEVVNTALDRHLPAMTALTAELSGHPAATDADLGQREVK